MKRASSDALAATQAPHRKSWIASANDPLSDFSIQNLPFGIFSDPADDRRRGGVAIGDWIVDLCALNDAGRLPGGSVFAQPTLNDFIASGRDAWRQVRIVLSALLCADNAVLRDDAALSARVLVPRTAARLHLPVDIPGYTDFYSSKEHATHVGSMFRDPANALLPNWSEMPIAYNGRASSVVVSGTPVRRPNGQFKLPGNDRPVFGACRKLDIELETGFIIGKGNPLGQPIRCEQADTHIFGMVLLNDWSARDIQQWEYVPLGPFNAKGFATTISPWIVTMDALEPFRCAPPPQSPQPLAYLRHANLRGVDLHLEVALQIDAAAASADGEGCLPSEHTLARTGFRQMYWTMAQQLAHHTVSGCNTRIGDLMGSGTVSGTGADACGSLLEMTRNGGTPIRLSVEQQRTFLEDGDTVVLRGWGQGDGYRVGFGDCEGTILPAFAATDESAPADARPL